jgi:Cu2+-exporting ATPase
MESTASNALTPPAADHDAVAVLDDPLEQGRFTRWVAGPAGERWAESSLQLAGMHCAACSGIIERALCRVPGVRSAQVSAAAEQATVRWDPELTRASALIAAVRGAGYDAVPDAAAPARALRVQQQRQALWRLFVAGFCAMQVMMFATPSYVAGPGELSDEMRQLLNWGSWILSLPVMAFSATPYLAGAWRALRTRTIGMDVPVALGVVITFVASTGATFDPGGVFGHEVYFDSLTMFVTFLLGARWLELRARQGAAASLERAMARLPETAWRVADDGSVAVVSVLRLHVGDRVRVPLGQAFPADGVVEQGQTQADESLLSGESAPVRKGVGDAVVAGSTNVGAPVQVRVLRIGGDTRLETIVSMMRSALTQRPALARVADRWAAPFLWAVLLLAAGAAAAWSVIEPARAVWVAVSVLIVTCPCALSLAAPATLVAAARGLARRGVLLQRLDALEVLATARHFFFDKTGTLTEDRLQCSAVHLSPAAVALGDTEAGMQAMAAGLAAWSSHPVSRALADAAAAPQAALHDVHEVAGQGAQGTDAQGRVWRLGRAAWVDRSAAVPEDTSAALGCDGQWRAAFVLQEVLREGAAQALQALRADGVRLHLLSGDRAARVQALAARLGLDDVMAAATPEAKLTAVAALQQRGERVVMVGDGVNDAPVLARADASLAMGQGALVARSHADAVITSSQLADVVRARRSSQRALRIVRQNLLWAAAYNALCIPLALAGLLPPWAAGLGMATSSLLVVLNALRAAR